MSIASSVASEELMGHDLEAYRPRLRDLTASLTSLIPRKRDAGDEVSCGIGTGSIACGVVSEFGAAAKPKPLRAVIRLRCQRNRIIEPQWTKGRIPNQPDADRRTDMHAV